MNETQANILRKKRERMRRRRRKILRFFLSIVLVVLFLTGIGTLAYGIYYVGSTSYGKYQEMYHGYLARKAARENGQEARFDGYTNVLFLGLDDGADLKGTDGLHADSVLLLSLDNSTGKMRVVTIPANVWMRHPQGGADARLSDFYAQGGENLMVQAVSKLLQVPVHQYVTFDMTTFSELVDLMGGVDLYVENDMEYEDPQAELFIHLEKGYQHLDGLAAQKYLRYRGTELGDVGRVQRQQRFFRALYEDALKLETIPRLPAIAELFRTKVKSSAEIFDSAHFAKVLRGLSTELPEMVLLPGKEAASDHSVFFVDEELLQERMEKIFLPVEEEN